MTALADRDLAPDETVWAVCWQAALGRDFFVDPALPEKIRARLIGAHATSGRALLDFLLLPTSIHATVRIAHGDSVAAMAGAVGHVISRWAREAQPIRGPIFADRYRAEELRTIEDLQHEIRMLAWRPVLLGLCVTPNHYPRGGLRTALGLTSSSGFDTRPLLDYFGRPVPLARAVLRRLIRRRPSDQDWRAWELSRGLELATGRLGPHAAMARPVERSAALLIASGGSYSVEGALEVLWAWVEARIRPYGSSDLRSASMAESTRCRALVACLATSHRLCSAASVARYFQRSRSTICEQMSMCRTNPVDRQIIATPLRRILQEVEALSVAMLPTRQSAAELQQRRKR